ncbi:MAG: glycoside hydrolase family 9 protein [Verrucomicrobiota bacterium]
MVRRFGILAWLLKGVAALGQPTDPLALPPVGASELQIISPSVVELNLVSTKPPGHAPVSAWDFVADDSSLRAPATNQLTVLVNGRPQPIRRVGLKRRVLYAPLKRRDLRIGNWLYLELEHELADGDQVEVLDSGALLGSNRQWLGQARPSRWSPAIHVNQLGYVPAFPKKAMVGYYLGNLGELPLPKSSETEPTFAIEDARSGRRVFSGPLRLRPDQGFTFPTYQKVWQADFSALRQPGEYKLVVPGLGESYRFWIDEGIAAGFARAYALGLYHQRCGSANEMPYTRFTHGPCHFAPAEVPTKQFKATQQMIRNMADDAKKEPRHSAPPLVGVEASLYPFVRQGKIDVSGGHHDAGDYSKYTINSAALIHYLVFAADALPGVGQLDNLGVPESGDGKSDLLQEAKWEADFLAKMQDADGGFYFLVYPKDRPYEDDVLPDHGDPQVVWPKNTSATAAAVAALAQASSSRLFRQQFPEAAERYWQAALKGWQFLDQAIKRHGRDGAYQKISHYGDEFLHDDELVWAGTEMFLATGDRTYEQSVIKQFDPADRETRRWTWWRMFEAYGCAIRSYAFAPQTRRNESELTPGFLTQCRNEVLAAAQDQVRFARESAYGTSFPDPSKRFRNAGWYFSPDRAFDVAVAAALDPNPAGSAARDTLLEAVVSNLNFEGGCNPVNIVYVTGLGWRRQRELVHHYAQNDQRLLPPSGLPIGNIQAGFQFLHHYQKELGQLSFPADGDEAAPYPFYDRWGDSFNVTTEFVIPNQGRSLATLAWLMAQTSLTNQPWRPEGSGRIVGLPASPKLGESFTARAEARGLDLTKARIVWEGQDVQPQFGDSISVRPRTTGKAWLEMEASWADGRRVVAMTNWVVAPP